MKRFLRVLLVAVVVLVLLGVAARYYLSSGYIASQVASRLESMLGGQVQVASADVGWSGSTANGVEFYEKEKSVSQKPWLTVKSVTTDVTLLGALTGTTTPNHVTLSGASVTLRFSRDGHLLTVLPEAPPGEADKEVLLPKVRIEDSRITFQRDGGPSLVATGINATLIRQGDRLVLAGAVGNPERLALGKWSLQGGLDPKGRTTSVTLTSEGAVHVTQRLLEELPFVSPTVWREVQVKSADSPVTVQIRYDLARSAFQYHVALEPQNAEVYVPAIELNATALKGKIELDDGLVQVRYAQGQMFGGTIRANGTVDMRSPELHLHFPKVEVQGLEMRRIPKSWDVPRQIEGRLQGSAWLDVVFGKDGKPQVRGEGKGEIVDARVAGLPTDGPVRLELHAREAGFGFRSPEDAPKQEAEGQVLPAAFLIPSTLLVQNPEHKRVPLPARAVNSMAAALDRTLQGVGATGMELARFLPRQLEPKQKPGAPGRTIDVSLKLSKVDLAKFVQGLGLKLPFQVAGRLSLEVKASLPLDTPKDMKSYRASGSAEVTNLRLQGVQFNEIRGKVDYADGILSVPDVRGRIADGKGKPGTFTGSARLQVVPLGPFTGKAVLHALDLSLLQRLDPKLRPPVPVAGRFDTTAVVEGNLAPLSVRTTGTSLARSLRVSDATLNNLAFAWKSDNDRLIIEKLHADLYEGAADGKAVFPLRPNEAGSLDLRLKDVDVGALAKSLPKLPFSVEGKAGGSVKATLLPAPLGKEREATVGLDLRAQRLNVQGIATDQFAGSVGYQRGTLDYRFEGKALGGTFELNGQVPAEGAAAKEGKEGRLQVRGARLSGLAGLFGQRPDMFPLDGIMDLEVIFRHARPDGFPVGRGQITISRPRWAGVDLCDQVQADVLLGKQEAQLRNVTANVGEGVFRGQAVLSLQRPGEGWFSASLEGVEVATLLVVRPDLAGIVQGRLDARLRGRLNHEWNGSGDVVLGRGKLYGVEVTEWRLPLTWSFSPRAGRGEISVRDSAATLATGRATGQATLGWGNGVRLDGKLQFANVDLRTVSRQFADSPQLGSGRVTGRFDFAATDMHSLNDLTGTLQAKLVETQAFQTPLLYQVAPFLGIQSSLSFDQGTLRARLTCGTFRIENLMLWGQSLRVHILGNVTLAGRLDLDVTARTGTVGIDPARLTELGLASALPAVIPVTAMGQVSRYLSNRLLHLRVTGTVRNPNVRVEPLCFLTQEALQFFLNQANIPIAVPFP
jgi:hypothetical protein